MLANPLNDTPCETQKPLNRLRLASVRTVAKLYADADIKESSLRWLIFNEYRNGFSQCIRRIGRKVLIDLDDFEKWIDGQKKIVDVSNIKPLSKWN